MIAAGSPRFSAKEVEGLRQRAVRLRAMSQQLMTLAQDLEATVESDAPAKPVHLPACVAADPQKRRELHRAASHLFADRRLRERWISRTLFSEPAWDIMLDLYIKGLEGEAVATTSLAVASSIPTTTALRWIATLEEAGFLEREESIRDRRVHHCRLTEKGFEAMTCYFERRSQARDHRERTWAPMGEG